MRESRLAQLQALRNGFTCYVDVTTQLRPLPSPDVMQVVQGRPATLSAEQLIAEIEWPDTDEAKIKDGDEDSVAEVAEFPFSTRRRACYSGALSPHPEPCTHLCRSSAAKPTTRSTVGRSFATSKAFRSRGWRISCIGQPDGACCQRAAWPAPKRARSHSAAASRSVKIAGGRRRCPRTTGRCPSLKHVQRRGHAAQL